MEKFFKGLRKVETVLAVIAMVAFTVVAFLQVFFRVFLHAPLAWSEELCKFCFIWCMYLGSILVSADEEHFTVDFFTKLMPPVVQAVLRYLSYALIALFSFILIKYGWGLVATNMNRVSPALSVHMGYIYTIFPLNGVLVLVHVIERIYHDIISSRGSKEVTE